MAKGKKKKQVTLHKPSLEYALTILSKGNSRQEAIREVSEYRKQKGLTTTSSIVRHIVDEATKVLSNEYGTEKSHIVALHVERYNRDIERIISMPNIFEKIHRKELGMDDEDDDQYGFEETMTNYDPETLAKLRQSLISSYYTALSTMFNKEKVLQMHTKGFQVLIVNKLTVDIALEGEVNYDISKLSDEEKKDMLQLMLKARKTDFELGSVILRDRSNEQETIDVEHEVVEDEVNISKIKHEEKTIAESGKNGNALFEINKKLAETLAKKAEAAFKKAGSKN